MASTIEILKSVLAKEFGVNPDSITQDTNLFSDLDIDSIDAIDLLARLRELTGKALPAEQLRQVRTVGDIIKLVEAH